MRKRRSRFKRLTNEKQPHHTRYITSKRVYIETGKSSNHVFGKMGTHTSTLITKKNLKLLLGTRPCPLDTGPCRGDCRDKTLFFYQLHHSTRPVSPKTLWLEAIFCRFRTSPPNLTTSRYDSILLSS